MTKVMGGQFDLFDLLEKPACPSLPTVARRPEPPEHKKIRRDIMYFGTRLNVKAELDPAYPVYCVYCGAEQTTWLHLNMNHGLMDVGRGWTCQAMALTSNHVTAYARAIKAQLEGKQASQCCFGKGEVHGKAVRKPTIMQLADHLRERIEYARKTWGVHADQFDEWLGPYLLETGLLKYSLDPAEYPWEFEGAQ